jgi:uracil-DNA glycosylase
MRFSLSEIHPSWGSVFAAHRDAINQFLESLGGSVAPARSEIFRAFSLPLDQVRVVIVGQDPYPGDGVADGLAFSSRHSAKVPASLRNIFREYSSDLGLPIPDHCDLSAWQDSGVLLLNRTLTTTSGESNAHRGFVWNSLTSDVARELGHRGVIAILWGKNAQELGEFFEDTVESVHPSPLSAHRGFFGSKPFSQVNRLLVERGQAPIDWRL